MMKCTCVCPSRLLRYVLANDFFQGAMRVIVIARQTLTPATNTYSGVLAVVSEDPSNPNFDQFIFESITTLI
jgi:exportin-2 (importin alpha re-exporter)